MSNDLSMPAADEPRIIRDSYDDLWEKYKTLILSALILSILASSYFIWKWFEYEQMQEETHHLLSQAENLEQLRGLSTKLPTVPAAAEALVKIQALLVEQNQFAEASENASRFIQSFPNHPLVQPMEYSRAECLHAGGKTEEAIAAYRSIHQASASHAFSGLAAIKLARAHIAKEEFAQAKIVLRDFIETSPDHMQVPEARQILAGMPPSLDDEPELSILKPQSDIAPATTPAESGTQP